MQLIEVTNHFNIFLLSKKYQVIQSREFGSSADNFSIFTMLKYLSSFTIVQSDQIFQLHPCSQDYKLYRLLRLFKYEHNSPRPAPPKKNNTETLQ